jgi:Zn-dependent alcohol dehydrogenase
MEITAAIVKEKGGNFELAKVILGQPASDVVLVKIVATDICHTDMVARDFIMGSPNFPVKEYAFEDINQAIEDSEKGRTIKSVLKIGEYRK